MYLKMQIKKMELVSTFEFGQKQNSYIFAVTDEREMAQMYGENVICSLYLDN